MTEETQATSGATNETSGSLDNKDSGNGASSGAQDQVPYGTYKKAVSESRNRASENQDLKQQNEEMADKLKGYEEEKMLKDKNFEKFISVLKEENAKLKGEVKNKDTILEGGKKNTSLLIELKKLGFDDTEANREMVLKTIDSSGVIPDPATGVIVGADEAAKGYYDKYNHLNFFKKKTPGVNRDAPDINTEVDGADPYISELRQCKTQIEFDKVRAKYNKT